MLAKTISRLLGKPNYEIKIIGTRHGEKLYETLLTKEMVKAVDLENYYRIQQTTVILITINILRRVRK